MQLALHASENGDINVKDVHDRAKVGAFCTYCVFATATAPLLLWLIWRLR